MWLKNGVLVRGNPPKSASSGPKIITHRSQRISVASSTKRLDNLLSGKARACIYRCLAGDTKLLMADGSLKEIKDVNLGDFVINMKGDPTKVISKTYSGRPNKVVSFRSTRMLDYITCTPEHLILVLDLREFEIPKGKGISYFARKKYAKDLIRWIPAIELNEKTFPLLPSDIKLQLIDQEQIDLAAYLPENSNSKVSETEIFSVGKSYESSFREIAAKLNASYWQVAEVSRNRVKFTRSIHFQIKEELDKLNYVTKTKRNILVGYNLGKFFGLVLGDGSMRLRYNKKLISSGEISIAVNSNYKDQIQEIKRIVNDLFGLTCSEYKSKTSKCVQVVFYSIPIAKMLLGFGKKIEKKLPPEFLFNNKEYLRGLLDGLIQSDGWICNSGAISFDNISPYLISLYYWLQNQFGNNSKIYYSFPRISNFNQNQRLIRGTSRSLKARTFHHKGASNHQRITGSDGVRYDISEIIKKDILDKEVDVWDIGVSDHSSFIAENQVVHNSLGGLGDIIMATPISRGFKTKFPDSHLTYAVPADYAGGDLVALLENNPYIDEVIDYKLINRDDYDAFSDITRVGLSDEKPYTIPPNRIDLFANASGVPLFGNYQPIYVMTEDERVWGENYVKAALNNKKYKGLISVHLGSRDPKRSWPHYQIREFLNRAHQEGYFCFLYEWGGAANDWKIAGTNLVFDYGIRQAAAVMKATDVLVCPDSMMLHLAGALNFKTVSLFGSMPPGCRINRYPNAIAVVNQQLACLGCIYASCSNQYYCMKSILPNSVLAAVEMKINAPVIESTTTLNQVTPSTVRETINTFMI